MVPVIGKAPFQAPDAAQLFALVALHCNVTDAPTVTLLSLAFRITDGGGTAVLDGVLLAAVVVVPAALLAAGVLVSGVLDVSAFELAPHAASAQREANARMDFNANANLMQRLRRIELITRLPRLSATTFSAECDSLHPQSLRSHIHSISLIRQPVAICKLHMFTDANKFTRVLKSKKSAHENSRRALATTDADRVAKKLFFQYEEIHYKNRHFLVGQKIASFDGRMERLSKSLTGISST